MEDRFTFSRAQQDIQDVITVLVFPELTLQGHLERDHILEAVIPANRTCQVQDNTLEIGSARLSCVSFSPAPWFSFGLGCFPLCCINSGCWYGGICSEGQFLGSSWRKHVRLMRFKSSVGAASFLLFLDYILLIRLLPLWPLKWCLIFLLILHWWLLSLWNCADIFLYHRTLTSPCAGLVIWSQLVWSILWVSGFMSLLRPFILLRPTNQHFKKQDKQYREESSASWLTNVQISASVTWSRISLLY